MKNIQKHIRNLQKDKLCHYVFGLYYESKQYYEQAKLSFEKAKILDPSFQPCYPAIKRCSLYLLEKKQKSHLFINLKPYPLTVSKKSLKRFPNRIGII